MLNIEKLRAETPGCKSVAHFNNAGASLMPRPVIDVVKNYIDAEAMAGGYEAATKATESFVKVYASIAKLIGASPHEVAFMESATAAWNGFFYSFPLNPGDEVITTEPEYGSSYIAFLQLVKRSGIKIVTVPSDGTGAVSLFGLEQAINSKTKLISLTHVPSNGGLVQPAAKVGEIARAARVPFILDACQSVGQLEVDVKAIGCDALSATGRKYLRGPRGTGFLYVSEAMIERLEPHVLDHHAAELTSPSNYKIRKDARRFEQWERNFAGMLGLGAAVDYMLSIGIDAIEPRVKFLAAKFRTDLAKLPHVAIHDLGEEKCGIVTFSMKGVDSTRIKSEGLGQGFNVAISNWASTPLDMSRRGLDSIVRASVHYYNTEEELVRFVAFLHGLT